MSGPALFVPICVPAQEAISERNRKLATGRPNFWAFPEAVQAEVDGLATNSLGSHGFPGLLSRNWHRCSSRQGLCKPRRSCRCRKYTGGLPGAPSDESPPPERSCSRHGYRDPGPQGMRSRRRLRYNLELPQMLAGFSNMDNSTVRARVVCTRSMPWARREGTETWNA